MIDLLRLALRNLLGHKLRTFLTMLGSVFGVGSVIAMLGLGTGAEQAILREIGRLGIGNIILNSVKPPDKTRDTEEDEDWILRYGLTFKDEKQIRETIPGLKRALPVHRSRKTVWWGSRRAEAMVNAVTPVHLPLFDLNVVHGRTLTEYDDATFARVCVIRAGLLEQLGVFEDTVGKTLNVDGVPFRIIGILEDEPFVGYARKALSLDDNITEIYVPYNTVRNRIGTMSVRERTGSFEATDVELSQIVVAVEEPDDVLHVASMLERLLEKNHEEVDYQMVVPIEELTQRRKTQRIFNTFLFLIAAISLLVGGIGIANIMLSTVTERTREIGVRRALGAKRRHIMQQFLTETVTVSVLGGLVGVMFGYLFSWGVVEPLTGYDAIITRNSIVLSLGISMVVGVLSGIYPARRAARLDPISALRHE